MNPLLQLLPSQVEAAGKFASAALERNIAVGAIVLLVCAIVAMWFWIRSKDNSIEALNREHNEKVEKLIAAHATALADRGAQLAKVHKDHADFDKAKSERIAAEMKEKDERGYAQNEKLITAVTLVTGELRGNKEALDRLTANLDSRRDRT